MKSTDESERSSHASQKAGLPPGTILFIGEKRVEHVIANVMEYDELSVEENSNIIPENCREYIDRKTNTWINITGLHDTDLLGRFGEAFGLHSLVLEDIAHTNQRPKLEDHDDYIFCVLHMIYRIDTKSRVVSEQISMILGKNYIFTFQEMEGDVFELIRERIRSGKGRIRKMGVDYLAYALIDAIVDNYFVLLEDIGERIETLQESIIANPDQSALQKIHKLRRELIFLRKRVWPLRELVAGMEKAESKLIHKSLTPFLRDVYEHTIQVMDNVESLRDIVSGIMDIYITMISNRTNDVMKVLTVIATIFIPLTFVAGIYGMNFDHMPELNWRYGYAAVWALMSAIAIAMITYFKRHKWL